MPTERRTISDWARKFRCDPQSMAVVVRRLGIKGIRVGTAILLTRHQAERARPGPVGRPRKRQA